MRAEWYYADDGRSIGPTTVAEIHVRILAAQSSPHFVWTDGMAEWAEARNVPEFASAFPVVAALASHGESGHKRKGISAARRAELARRAKHELYQFLGISAYLWVCFGALILYKAAILRSVGVDYAPMGLALVKALISAKFIMLLEVFRLGERGKGKTVPFIAVLRKSSVFTIFLIALTVIEELLVGHLHGKESREILADMAGGTWPQALSVGVLMFLIMVPFFAFREAGAGLWSLSRD